MVYVNATLGFLSCNLYLSCVIGVIVIEIYYDTFHPFLATLIVNGRVYNMESMRGHKHSKLHISDFTDDVGLITKHHKRTQLKFILI